MSNKRCKIYLSSKAQALMTDTTVRQKREFWPRVITFGSKELISKVHPLNFQHNDLHI